MQQTTRPRWLGPVLVAVVLLAWALFLRGQLTELRTYSWRIAPAAFVLAILWGALYFGGLAFCWALLLRQIGDNPTPVGLAAAARVWLLSMLARYTPGNVWHIVSRVALARQLQVAPAAVLLSAAVEQGLTLLGVLALFGLTLPFWGIVPVTRGPLLLLLPVGLLLLHPRVFGAMLAWAATRLRRPELAWNYGYGQLLTLLVAYSGAMLCSGLALYTVLWGLGPVRLADLPLVIGASAVAWAIGYLSFLAPAGLGVREAALVALLSQVYPLPVAVVSSLLSRLVLTLGELLAVGLGWIWAQQPLGQRIGDGLLK